MKSFKSLLESNKTFRKIYTEEAVRFGKLLKEYNEAQIWRNMPESLRTLALLTADDDMGPDFADEYAGEDNWMALPDVVTNRINISDFDVPDNINLDALIRFIEDNQNNLPNQAWYKGSIGNAKTTNELISYLKSGASINDWTKKNIIGNMKLHGNLPDINYDELKSSDQQSGGFTKFDSSMNPRDLPSGAPSKNRDWRGGMWTGD
jgi:hypothetical protein